MTDRISSTIAEPQKLIREHPNSSPRHERLNSPAFIDDNPTVLLAAFAKFDNERRLTFSKIGCVLSLILVPAGCSLDYFVYPNLFWPIFKVRLFCNILTLGMFGLHFSRIAQNNTKILIIFWIGAVQGAISYMIYLSEGAISPYYAGLTLVILAVSVLIPYSASDSFFLCVMTLGMYILACMLHKGTPVDWKILFNNLYFLVLTFTICIAASYFNAKKRFEDFSLRHQLARRNEEIARSYEQLAELDQLKSNFFANISHELRTPLTLILSPAENLLRMGGDLPANVREVLEIVRDNGLRLLKLINDLLELIRIEAGQSNLKREPTTLNAFVPGLVESVRRLAEEKGLEIKFHGSKNNLIVDADYLRIEKAILNLLINAIKFTDPGGWILASIEAQKDLAVVEVKDSGIGIAKEDLPFIFDRFRQVNGSSARKAQGAGIGLALAREIIEELGGVLEVESEPDKGATFRIKLPLLSGVEPQKRASAEEDVRDPIEEINQAAARFLGSTNKNQNNGDAAEGTSPFTVLLIEDEPDLRRFLTSILTSDYKVLQAGDGVEGIEMARKNQPNIILLDLMLPGIDGLHVCKTIKKDETTCGIKVILLTARTDEAAKIEALEQGADDFLTKPFSTLEVKTRMANLLNSALLENNLRKKNTELKDALTRLRETEAQLIQTAKMTALGSLAAGILHEINNPLNYTMAALHMARLNISTKDENITEALSDIEEGMGRVADIVSSLREFAYPDASRGNQSFSVQKCLDSALKLAAAELNGVSVQSNMDPSCQAVGAQTQITHLFLNLLTNSANALKKINVKRKPEIIIEAATNHDRIHISVSDNGPGIEANNLDRLFEPFFTTNDVGRGMGLGMSVCFAILKAHDGNISVDSRPGAWTKVSFDLPLAKEIGALQ